MKNILQLCKNLQAIRYYTLNFVLSCFCLNFFVTSDLLFSVENDFTLISGSMVSIFFWFSEFSHSLSLFDKLANSISSYINVILNF
jgi:hypothetical protein